ncbi:hypothetical protein P775_27550 [Puniceibacterium antarcticum]|uniref:Uncharacterized protein n=2 Tax=Puniceibacterium antarcticum TaxID=1206336 RepID=A0A2G8QWR4_9RHOB|nr:hypothetical protein P775_27550 [Puniceibacterium antarcticum]
MLPALLAVSTAALSLPAMAQTTEAPQPDISGLGGLGNGPSLFDVLLTTMATTSTSSTSATSTSGTTTSN